MITVPAQQYCPRRCSYLNCDTSFRCSSSFRLCVIDRSNFNYRFSPTFSYSFCSHTHMYFSKTNFLSFLLTPSPLRLLFSQLSDYLSLTCKIAPSPAPILIIIECPYFFVFSPPFFPPSNNHPPPFIHNKEIPLPHPS